MRVFFCAGEASGDAYAAELFRALQRHDAFSPQRLADGLICDFADSLSDIPLSYPGPHTRDLAAPYEAESLRQAVVQDIECGSIEPGRLMTESVAGIGGRRLREAGVGIIDDSSNWGAVGILESLMVAPRVARGYRIARSLIRATKNGLFIPIDFGFINVRLAREAKLNGWKVLYFVPPGSWRKDKQGSDLPAVCDAIVTPFDWSQKILADMGANAHFFGHPIKDLVARSQFAGERSGLALLPGSREHEVAHNLPVLAEVARQLRLPVKIAVAPNLDPHTVQQAWQQVGGTEAEFLHGTYQVLQSCTAAVVCSGTATLESALCKTPLVVVYRGSKLMELEYHIRRPKIDHISMTNILLDRRAVPELIQWDATPEGVLKELEPLLTETSARAQQLSAFDELDALVGPAGCFERTAELALSL